MPNVNPAHRAETMDGTDKKAGGKAALGVLDIARIVQCIPHRFPFLLIDRVVEVEKDVGAVGIKNVTINEHFFAGHFPGPEIVVALGVNDDLGAVAVLLDGENDLGAQDDFEMAGDPFQFFPRVVGQRGGQFDVPGRDVNLHGGHPSLKTGIEINSLYNFTLGVSNQGAGAFPSQRWNFSPK
jgi:hypothetical protein